MDLKPYRAIVQARIAKNEGIKAWSLLDQRWLGLVEQARGCLTGITIRWHRQAAVELVRLSGAVEPRLIVETVLAIYLMHEQAGHRFRSDQAFDTQLVRRVRGLTELNARVSVSANGRSNKVYSELPPKATAIMAQWIKLAIGVGGVWFAKAEHDAAERRRKERDELFQGLAEVDFG